MVKNVIVFGSCNLDLFFEVPDMKFFSATGPKAEDALHFNTHLQAPGGKGANQALAAAKAGAKVHFFGAVGTGAHARAVLENFKPFGVKLSGVVETKAPTGLAVIFNQPNGKHKVVVSQGANKLAKAAQIPDKILNDKSILLLQAEVDQRENAALAKRAAQRGARVVVNVAPAIAVTAAFLNCVDDLILNEAEAHTVAKGLGVRTSDPLAIAKILAKKFALTCIVTLGEKGLIAVTSLGDVLKVPALKIKPVDTIGAGDAVCGAYVAALARGTSVKEALRNGAVAGSLACTRVGAQTALPSAQEIAKFLKRL